MSIINEALKKAGSNEPLQPETKKSGLDSRPISKLTIEAAKKKQKVNWGPVFVLMVLILITGPLVAPIFSSPYRSTNAAFLVPSYQETLAARENNGENRRAQFAIEESPILPASPAMKSPASSNTQPMIRPNFLMNGIVYANPDSYCIINGQVVKIGDKIDGAVLKSVTPEKAVLEYQGNTIELWVNH